MIPHLKERVEDREDQEETELKVTALAKREKEERMVKVEEEKDFTEDFSGDEDLERGQVLKAVAVKEVQMEKQVEMMVLLTVEKGKIDHVDRIDHPVHAVKEEVVVAAAHVKEAKEMANSVLEVVAAVVVVVDEEVETAGHVAEAAKKAAEVKEKPNRYFI